MHRAIRSLAGFTLALGCAVTASAADHAVHTEFARAMHHSMATMSREMEHAPMTGDPDHDFLAMMIPHHAGAVEMARLELIHGRDPLVRRLAEEILASQQAEIQAMRARLDLLEKHASEDYPAVHGTRGAAPSK